MENASKALVMAGSVLLALIIIVLLIKSFFSASLFQKTRLTEEDQAQLMEYNEQYTKYLGQYVYGTEVITIINKTLDDKSNKVTVTIDNEDITSSFINNTTDLKTKAFKCTNIGFDNSTGKVNSIKFEEKQWENIN